MFALILYLVGGGTLAFGLLSFTSASAEAVVGSPRVDQAYLDIQSRLQRYYNEITKLTPNFQQTMRDRVHDNVYWSKNSDEKWARERITAEVNAWDAVFKQVDFAVLQSSRRPELWGKKA